MSERTWMVVGGEDFGGILVREGEEVSSRKLDTRLATGSWVVEEELVGLRLRYTLKAGSGPHTGWVTTEVSNKMLLVRDTLVNDLRSGRWNELRDSLTQSWLARDSPLTANTCDAGELAALCRLDRILAKESDQPETVPVSRMSPGVQQQCMEDNDFDEKRYPPVFRISLGADDKPTDEPNSDDDDYLPLDQEISHIAPSSAEHVHFCLSDDEMLDPGFGDDDCTPAADDSFYDIEVGYDALSLGVCSSVCTETCTALSTQYCSSPSKKTACAELHDVQYQSPDKDLGTLYQSPSAEKRIKSLHPNSGGAWSTWNERKLGRAGGS